MADCLLLSYKSFIYYMSVLLCYFSDQLTHEPHDLLNLYVTLNAMQHYNVTESTS